MKEAVFTDGDISTSTVLTGMKVFCWIITDLPKIIAAG
jgi:hypothetical protein